jgi:hypothetical protein
MMSEEFEYYADSWKDLVEFKIFRTLNYFVGVFAFFIFGTILFVIPGTIVIQHTSFSIGATVEDLFILNGVGSFVLGMLWRNFHYIQNHFFFNSLEKLPHIEKQILTLSVQLQQLKSDFPDFNKNQSEVAFLSQCLHKYLQYENPELYQAILENISSFKNEPHLLVKLNEAMMNMQNDIDEIKSNYPKSFNDFPFQKSIMHNSKHFVEHMTSEDKELSKIGQIKNLKDKMSDSE